MNESTIIELAKILAPYFVAVVGILSPVITSKFLNKEELLKYKKQKSYTLMIETYSSITSEFYKLRRIIDEINEQAKIFDCKLMPELKEKQDKEYIEYIAQKTIEYDNQILKLTNNINMIIDKNYSYLKKEIINKIANITKKLNSPFRIFNWGILVMEIRKKEKEITTDSLKSVYTEGKNFYSPFLNDIEDIINTLKYEITGEK